MIREILNGGLKEVTVVPRSAAVRVVSKADGHKETGDDNLLCAAGNVVDVVAQSHKEVKEELRSAVEHLQLHGPTSLEGAATADDESEVMGPEFRVRIGSVGVGIASGCQDGAALDTRLCIVEWLARSGEEYRKWSP